MGDKHVVVLVDCQPESFGAARDETFMHAVLRELKSAKESDLPIIVVEFRSFGETDARVRELLKDYAKVVYVEKTRADGSEEVLAACREHGFVPEDFGAVGDAVNFRVFGVETHVCVYHTARSLGTTSGATVTVVMSACNRVGYAQHPVWWMFESLRNVRLAD